MNEHAHENMLHALVRRWRKANGFDVQTANLPGQAGSEKGTQCRRVYMSSICMYQVV